MNQRILNQRVICVDASGNARALTEKLDALIGNPIKADSLEIVDSIVSISVVMTPGDEQDYYEAVVVVNTYLA